MKFTYLNKTLLSNKNINLVASAVEWSDGCGGLQETKKTENDMKNEQIL